MEDDEIVKALEDGADINDLIEETSEWEVLEAAKEASNYEVIDNNYDLQSEATEKIAELLEGEAKEIGLEIDIDNLIEVVDQLIADDYAQIDSAISDTINDLNLDGVNVVVHEDGDSETILNTENISREELVEAIADSLYKENSESFDEIFNEILKEAAENENTSEDTLDKIVDKTESEEVLKAVAENENTSEDTLDKIVDKTESEEVLKAVAENENTSEDTLEKIENKMEEQANSSENEEQIIQSRR